MAALGALAPAGLSPQYGEGKNGCRGPIGLSQLPPAHNSHFAVSHYGLRKACGGAIIGAAQGSQMPCEGSPPACLLPCLLLPACCPCLLAAPPLAFTGHL